MYQFFNTRTKKKTFIERTKNNLYAFFLVFLHRQNNAEV